MLPADGRQTVVNGSRRCNVPFVCPANVEGANGKHLNANASLVHGPQSATQIIIGGCRHRVAAPTNQRQTACGIFQGEIRPRFENLGETSVRIDMRVHVYGGTRGYWVGFAYLIQDEPVSLWSMSSRM